MDKKKALKLAAQIVFFGALWGITEATLGFLLHFLPPTIAGIVMFPIAVFILVKAYKATGSRTALIFIGFVAAGIKAVDFLVPGMMPFKIINPMISIVMESMIVAVAYPMIKRTGWKTKLAGGLVTSIGWRLGYVLYMGVQFLITGFVSKYISTAGEFINFVLLNGILSGLLAFLAVAVEPKLAVNKLKFRPAYALAALVLALGFQLLL
ncbi:MAG: hypothetical protein R3232_05545 [Clostridia bacterium]|nr:hypothetical protein [Clostridia bacterium]